MRRPGLAWRSRSSRSATRRCWSSWAPSSSVGWGGTRLVLTVAGSHRETSLLPGGRPFISCKPSVMRPRLGDVRLPRSATYGHATDNGVLEAFHVDSPFTHRTRCGSGRGAVGLFRVDLEWRAVGGHPIGRAAVARAPVDRRALGVRAWRASAPTSRPRSRPSGRTSTRRPRPPSPRCSPSGRRRRRWPPSGSMSRRSVSG